MPTPTEHPQPPPRSPFLPPAPRPQPPPSSPALQQRAWAGLTLSMLGLLSMVLISNIQRAVYVVAVAVVVTATALVLTTSAMSAARRARTQRPRGALFGTVLGVIGIASSGLALAGLLLFSAQFKQYANCLGDAGAVTAQQTACRTQLSNSVDTKLGVVGGR